MSESLVTKIVSDEEKLAKMQLAEQIKKVSYMGTKLLIKQVESANTSEEYKAACSDELSKRDAVYMAKMKGEPAPLKVNAAHAPVEAPAKVVEEMPAVSEEEEV